MAPPHDISQTEDSATLRSSSPRITNYETMEDGKKITDSPDNTLPTAPSERTSDNDQPTNEYVLNVAFYSFVGFMIFQAGFAIIANSSSMLGQFVLAMNTCMMFLLTNLANTVTVAAIRAVSKYQTVETNS